MSYKGDAIVAVGVIIILTVLYLGYGLYVGIQNNAVLQSQTSGGGSINASVGGLTSNLNNTFNVSAYYLIDVVILFLFANVGYKIALIGLQVNKDESHPQAVARVKGRKQQE